MLSFGKARRTGGVLCISMGLASASLFALAGCSEPAASWDLSFADDVPSEEVVSLTLEVRVGGCESSELHYQETISRDEALPSVGGLPVGVLGFAAVARDSECNVIAEECVNRSATDLSGAAVRVILVSVDPIACDGRCDEGICAGTTSSDAGADAELDADAADDAAEDAGPDATSDAEADAADGSAGDGGVDALSADGDMEAGDVDAADADPDSSCSGLGCTCPTTSPENTAAACSDGCDNDVNGFVDCADWNCRGLAGCPLPEGWCALEPAVEQSAAACSDGCDNDHNSFIDCEDFACAGLGECPGTPRPPVCGPVPSEEESTPADCSDGCDNDANGFADCVDFGCRELSICGVRCAGPDTPENTPAACSDGCSNDSDVFVDCDDFDCAGIGLCPA